MGDWPPRAGETPLNQHHDNYHVHMVLDGGLSPAQAVTVAATRVTDDFLENLLGHRSGIGAVLGGTIPSAERSIGGPQTTAPAYGALTTPPLPVDSWYGQNRGKRYNSENF